MKKYIAGFILLVNLSVAMAGPEELGNTYTLVDKNSIENYSVVVLFDNEYVEYESKADALYSFTFSRKTTYHRKIRINKENAIDDFNKIYIPIASKTLSSVTGIEGVTIKPDGKTFVLDINDVKETTLPANVPFYRKYNGKVDLFAFPNVNVGDEVEYKYTITDKVSMYSVDAFNDLNTDYFDTDYPVKEKNIVVKIPFKLNFKSFPVNSTLNFTDPANVVKGKPKIYTYSMKDLPVIQDEDFSIESEQRPGVIYQVYGNEKQSLSTSWDDELDGFFKKIRSNTTVTNDVTINDLVKKLKQKSNFKDQMQTICDVVNKVYFDKPEEYLKQAYETSYDAQDYNIYQKIAENMGYKVNFWFVNDKTNGKINREFPSLKQFDNVVIEYINAAGNESYYLPLYKPLDPLNFVEYDYNNTDALKVYQSTDGTKYNFETFKIKAGLPNKVVQTNRVSILANKGYTCTYDTRKEVFGQYLGSYKISAYNYKTEKDKNKLYNNIRNGIYDLAENVHCDSISILPFDPAKDKSVTFTRKFSIPHSIPKMNNYVLTLNSLMMIDQDFILNSTDRKTNAYFGFPHTLEYNYTISAEGGSLEANDNFNRVVTNELGTVTSSVKAGGDNTIVISIVFDVKADNCKKEDWLKYCELNNTFASLFQLPFIVR